MQRTTLARHSTTAASRAMNHEGVCKVVWKDSAWLRGLNDIQVVEGGIALPRTFSPLAAPQKLA
jgi:hypothetical protein